MNNFIEEFYIITDGDLKDKFCIAVQLINKDRTPFERLCRLLDDEKIPYEASEQKKRLLPRIELPK